MAEKPQTRSQYHQKRTTKKQRPTAQKRTGKFWKSLFFLTLFFSFFGIASGAAVFYAYAKDAPKLIDSKLRDPLSSKILDKDGKVFAEVGTERRDYVEYKDIPKKLEAAILSTEDSRFYEHDGLDPIRLGGAVFANIKGGFGSEGASTLSQQIIKMSYLNTNKTLARKSQEAWLALQLEEKYSKKDIIELYVNKVYLSDRIHGMATAAEHYYGKNLKDLSLAETALIAGMPQSPNNYNPYEHPEAATERRNKVLTNMYRNGKISNSELHEAKQVAIKKGLRSNAARKEKTYKYDAYVSQVLAEIPKEYDAYKDGLTIYTALDQDAQKYTEEMLDTNTIIQFSDNKMQAGVVLTNTENGRIQAIGGARNQKVSRGYNYATQLKRQVGSAMKPIADYGPAIEYLNWSTAHILNDSPYTYSSGAEVNNWDLSYKGKISLRQALYESRNIPALKTLQSVGLEKAKKFTNKLGFNYKNFYEAYAIGANPSSPLQLAGAYAAFGNKGIYTKPHAVIKVKLNDDTVIETEPTSHVAMKESTAYMVSNVLKDVLTKGTGVAASVAGVPVAGKTGTTNFDEKSQEKYNYPADAARDAWFAGYTTKYTAVVWNGYDDIKNYLSSKEQKISQRIFSKLMAHVSANKKTEDFEAPSNVESVPILIGSEPPARAKTDSPDSKISMELFISGTAPKQTKGQVNDDDDNNEKDLEDTTKEDESEKTKEKSEKEQEEQQKDEQNKKEQNEEPNEKPPNTPTGLSASYNKNTKQISVTWQSIEAASYEVSVGGQIRNVSSTSITVSGGRPGQTVPIRVVAIKNGKRSSPASTTITIPKENNDQNNDNNSNNNEAQDNDSHENDKPNNRINHSE